MHLKNKLFKFITYTIFTHHKELKKIQIFVYLDYYTDL